MIASRPPVLLHDLVNGQNRRSMDGAVEGVLPEEISMAKVTFNGDDDTAGAASAAAARPAAAPAWRPSRPRRRTRSPFRPRLLRRPPSGGSGSFQEEG